MYGEASQKKQKKKDKEPVVIESKSPMYSLKEVLEKISTSDSSFGNEELKNYLNDENLFYTCKKEGKNLTQFKAALFTALKRNHIITSLDLRLKAKETAGFGTLYVFEIMSLINNKYLPMIAFKNINYPSLVNTSIEITSIVSMIIEALQNNFAITFFRIDSDTHGGLYCFPERVKIITDRNTIVQKNFFTAVKNGCIEEVISILTHTNNQALFFKNPSDNMNTALHIAVESDNFNLAKYLIDKMEQNEIPLNIKNSKGQTPGDMGTSEKIHAMLNKPKYKSDSDSEFNSDSGSDSDSGRHSDSEYGSTQQSLGLFSRRQ